MSQQIQQIHHHAAPVPTTVNAGAVAIEQERAIAEAQGQLTLAKRFPRDLNAAHAELMIACKNAAFAQAAFYSVPNRGSGPSIRMAEEIARVVGNFQYGHRELSRDKGKSEIEVYAWDMEKNNRSTRQITVEHIRDTRQGAVPLRDQADIDNRIANVASKQMRGRILALMPKWLVEDAIIECRKTLAGDNSEPLEVRIRKMTQAFATFGVNTARIEKYVGCKISDITADQLVDLIGMHTALREGAHASDLFPLEAEAPAMEVTETGAKRPSRLAGVAAQAKTQPPSTVQNDSNEGYGDLLPDPPEAGQQH